MAHANKSTNACNYGLGKDQPFDAERTPLLSAFGGLLDEAEETFGAGVQGTAADGVSLADFAGFFREREANQAAGFRLDHHPGGAQGFGERPEEGLYLMGQFEDFAFHIDFVVVVV